MDDDLLKMGFSETDFKANARPDPASAQSDLHKPQSRTGQNQETLKFATKNSKPTPTPDGPENTVETSHVEKILTKHRVNKTNPRNWPGDSSVMTRRWT